jgi:hypothetical protein
VVCHGEYFPPNALLTDGGTSPLAPGAPDGTSGRNSSQSSMRATGLNPTLIASTSTASCGSASPRRQAVGPG